MNPTEGIVNFTADPHWLVIFTTETESWVEPLLGWAVVRADDGNTDMEPVILTEGRYPMTIDSVLDGMARPHPKVRIERRLKS